MMERFVKAGGKVVWFSTPPLIDKSGEKLYQAVAETVWSSV